MGEVAAMGSVSSLAAVVLLADGPPQNAVCGHPLVPGTHCTVTFFRQYRYLLLAMALLVVCSVAVIQHLNAGQSRHMEVREAFILLHTRGYTNESSRLYNHLLNQVHALSNKQLMDDFQRTLLVVDPGANRPDNLIWKYHWTVSNELERRAESSLVRALKLAEERK